jgi:predicted transcriptional regulator
MSKAFPPEVLSVPEQCARIIDTLIEKRKALGLTQKELADASHLTQSVIARMESKKAVPQLDTLLKVVDALGCDIEIKAV